MHIEEIKLGIAIASAIVAVVAVYFARRQSRVAGEQFQLARQQLQDTHDYSRRTLAIQLISQWDDKTLSARQVVMEKWEKCFNANQKIKYSEIVELLDEQIADRRKKPEGSNHPPLIIDELNRILNFLEVVASAVLNSVANEEMLKNSFYLTLNRWYLILDEYRENIRTQRGYEPWKPLIQLHRKWYGDETSSLPPTGVPSPMTKT